MLENLGEFGNVRYFCGGGLGIGSGENYRLASSSVAEFRLADFEGKMNVMLSIWISPLGSESAMDFTNLFLISSTKIQLPFGYAA